MSGSGGAISLSYYEEYEEKIFNYKFNKVMKNQLLKTMLLLFALIAGSVSTWGQTTLWSENFDGLAANATPTTPTNAAYASVTYTCVDGTGTSPGSTKVMNENLAGGTAPELMIGKKGSGTDAAGGKFTVVIPLDNIEGTLTLTYYQNKQTLKVSSTTTGVSGGQTKKPSDVGEQTTTFTGITPSMTSITIVFEATTTNNVRLDNIVLTGNKASSIQSPSFSLAEGFYTTAQSVTITTNEAGGTTYYTTDGTSPTDASTPYTSAISISSTTTLKAVTYKGSEHSAIVSATYSFVEDGVFDFVNVCGAGYDFGSGVTPTSDGTFYETTEKTWTAGNVTMVTDGKYRLWSDNTLRFYNNTPASSATFSAPAGKVIAKIVTVGGSFTSADNGSLDGTTWMGSSETVKLESGTSTLTLSKITVTYITPITVTIASSGYSTIASAFDLDFAKATTTNGSAIALEAYVVPSVTASSVALSAVSHAPAETGVILKGTPGTTYTIPIYPASAVGTNLLKAALTDTPVEANEVYILKSGLFHKVIGASTVPAGKAYLLASDVSASELTLDFEGGATGIDEVRGQMEEVRGDFYDLQGRKVVKPTKGLYIVNGRKVIIK